MPSICPSVSAKDKCPANVNKWHYQEFLTGSDVCNLPCQEAFKKAFLQEIPCPPTFQLLAIPEVKTHQNRIS